MNRRAAVIGLAAFLGVGGMNAMAEAVTGESLLEGGGSENDPQEKIGEQEWMSPVPQPPSTGYGVSGENWSSGYHTGVDFSVGTGTPVKAASSGWVVQAGWGGAYGNQVVVGHIRGVYTQYAHLSRVDVKKGDSVDTGARIGVSGDSGNSTGPHLHFEVRSGENYGSDIDPVKFFREQGIYLYK